MRIIFGVAALLSLIAIFGQTVFTKEPAKIGRD